MSDRERWALNLRKWHVAYGVKEQHYNTLCSALVWAFGQALQPGFDDEVRAAWTAVIRAVNEQMKIGADAVPSNEQTPTPATN